MTEAPIAGDVRLRTPSMLVSQCPDVAPGNGEIIFQVFFRDQL